MQEHITDYVDLENPFESLTPVTPFVDTALGMGCWMENAVHILGIPFDATTSYRPGARFGPSAIREAAQNLESYSPYLEKSLDDATVYDLGNIPFLGPRLDWIREYFLALTKGFHPAATGAKLLTLGGEHSISYSPLSLYLKEFPDLLVIHLDAHTDLRDGYLGEPYSHAAVLFRVAEEFQAGHQLLQYGIRSGPREDFQWMEKHGTWMKSREEFFARILDVSSTRPIYLTLDLDYFDPCFMPGTGTPEAGGEDFHSFVKLMKILKNKNLVGADVVELAPQIDPTGQSSSFAAKVVRELLLALA